MTDSTEAPVAQAPSEPAPPSAPAYEPERLYAVTLNCAADLPTGVRLVPGKGRRNMVKGKYIAGLGEAVSDAVPV